MLKWLNSFFTRRRPVVGPSADPTPAAAVHEPGYIVHAPAPIDNGQVDVGGEATVTGSPTAACGILLPDSAASASFEATDERFEAWLLAEGYDLSQLTAQQRNQQRRHLRYGFLEAVGASAAPAVSPAAAEAKRQRDIYALVAVYERGGSRFRGEELGRTAGVAEIAITLGWSLERLGGELESAITEARNGRSRRR